MNLTDEYWTFIEYLQQYYLQHDWPQSSHELTQKLDNAFAEQGGMGDPRDTFASHQY
jgi:sulfur relay (sulfurtransferase) DsrC/TusE family protein